MKEDELRTPIRESDLNPIRVCMDDGRTFTINHPDFGMVADDAVIIGSGPGNELRDASFVIRYFDHIAREEELKKRVKAA